MDLPTIQIKGKSYVLVKDRLLYFNEHFTKGAIKTEIIPSQVDNLFVVKATVWPDASDELRCFTGHSQAPIGGAGVNAVASLENAETSAIGRALALVGIGVIDSIASVDEMNKASFKAPAQIRSNSMADDFPPPVEYPLQPLSNDGEVQVADAAMPPCPKCKTGRFKLIPAGVSKKTNKPYGSFWACQTKNCRSTMDAQAAADFLNL